jgi:hypothetical protein
MERSDVLPLGAAGLALAFSVYLWFSGFREEGMFVGLWVPSTLSLACYVKLASSGRR